MADPRHYRLVYDADNNLFYAAFDFGLSPEAPNFADGATVEVYGFSFTSEWGFRGALQRYYDIFPKSFEKRVPREGLWMAFTDISTVTGWEDFGFAYHEGTNNVAFDDAHDILTFEYTEPMTTWLALPQDVPRTYDGALDYLRNAAADPAHKQNALAKMTLESAVRSADGGHVLAVQNAPWCDGAVFALNPDPDLKPEEEGVVTRGPSDIDRLTKTVNNDIAPAVEGWHAYGAGFSVDDSVAHSGAHSLRLTSSEAGKPFGSSQSVELHQSAASPLTIRGWVRTENAAGEANNDMAIYVDLKHTDGTPLYGRAIPIEPGTADWHEISRTIESDKPFASATVHLLLRGNHTGTVWFDDLALTNSDGQNLLANAGFEGPPVPPPSVDGTYIDSYTFWSTTLNYDRRHFASTDVPLVYDQHMKKPAILTVFSTFEFEKAIAERMHAQGRYMMANAVLHNWPFAAHYLDVLGTETNWFSNGEWAPMSDAEMLLKRTMCYQKPYCFLLNTDYTLLDLADIERYMQRCLFYGMFPGFFSQNASTDCFFEDPSLYEPARPLFKEYVALTQTIAAAGWEPIPYVRVNDPRVYVERFGPGDDGYVYISAMNETDETVDAVFTLARAPFEWEGGDAAELVAGGAVTIADGAFTAAMPPQSVRLFRLRSAAKGN